MMNDKIEKKTILKNKKKKLTWVCLSYHIGEFLNIHPPKEPNMITFYHPTWAKIKPK
jgi:hypothetical protein